VGPLLGAKGWHDLISGSPVLAVASEHPPKNAQVNYQSLGPIYGPNDVAKNKQLLDMTDIPNAILQMAYNKLYIPLLMLTTSALSRIHTNDSLKFHKIPFGNSIGKQSLDESSFLTEDSLTETTFLQAYRKLAHGHQYCCYPQCGCRMVRASLQDAKG